MRPGATKIESAGSYWWIDDGAKEYLRTPKYEGPREPGPDNEDWGGPDAGSLQDLVWHPFEWWEIRPMRFGERLVIHLDDDPEGLVVTAPLLT